jgi:putative ATP-binding cassette transporter
LSNQPIHIRPHTSSLFFRYWKSASKFWYGSTGLKAWALFSFLIFLILFQLLIQYLINYWNRDFFNALNNKNTSLLWTQAIYFLPLALGSVGIAVLNVLTKMTLQRNWREWLSNYLIQYWLKDNHYNHLKVIKNDQLNAEYRIAEDARVATDLPIDLTLGFVTSVLTAFTFISVLWDVGGSLNLSFFGFNFFIPGYLVFSAIGYSTLLSSSMLLISRNLTDAVDGKNHSEADLRAAGSRLRSHGEKNGNLAREKEEKNAVINNLNHVIECWKILCWQLMRTTCIAHSNGLIEVIAEVWSGCFAAHLVYNRIKKFQHIV